MDKKDMLFMCMFINSKEASRTQMFSVRTIWLWSGNWKR